MGRVSYVNYAKRFLRVANPDTQHWRITYPPRRTAVEYSGFYVCEEISHARFDMTRFVAFFGLQTLILKRVG